MPSITHPFDTDTLYQVTEDGTIRVSNGNSVGIFTREGVYLSGDLRFADPQLCVWVGNNPDPDTVVYNRGRDSG
ncbi:MAG: hypothetical protein AAF648_11190 [Pseudomonadota bacterium]